MKSQPLHGVFESRTKKDKGASNTFNSFAQTVQDYINSKARIIYYETVIIPDADHARKKAMEAFEKEKINEHQLLASMSDYISTQEEYLKVITNYHQAVVNMESFFGKQYE